MASALAHELNQPLTATRNYLRAAQMLMDRGAEADQARLRAQLLDDLRHDPVGLLQQREQQVLGLDLGLVVLGRDGLRADNGLLSLLGVFV